MSRKSKGAAIVFGLIYLLHGFIILFYSFNLPFMDEWEALRPQGLPAGFNVGWLFAQHNEHRIFLTKVQTWLLYWADGWNLRAQQASNYVIFGILLFVLLKIQKKDLKK